ncbi:MAG: hypothetical protein SGJ24_01130 [Chloroflexota bacterium]|nr:hypothetical protein [Chloroflexota bacterium]
MTQDKPSFFTYPDNKVIAVLPDMRAVDAAVQDLKAAGADQSHIEVMQGKQAADNLDLNGENHGAFGVTLRFFQNLLDGEGQTLKEHHAELEAGHAVIAVHADTREDALAIGVILKQHAGRLAFYYTALAVETILE